MDYIASAYPNSALSALTMMTIAFVVVGTLAAWLGLVFLADRTPHKPREGQAQAGGDTTLAALGAAAQDEHSGPARHRVGRPSRAA